MESVLLDTLKDSVSINARMASEQEYLSMMALVTRHDAAKRARDYAALMATFHPDATCEFTPIGLRIGSIDMISEMYQRTLAKLSTPFLTRRKLREWSNGNGLLREWVYPVASSSGREIPTKQIEIFEFVEDLKLIGTYRVRMNAIYSDLFGKALGSDYLSLPGVERIAG